MAKENIKVFKCGFKSDWAFFIIALILLLLMNAVFIWVAFLPPSPPYMLFLLIPGCSEIAIIFGYRPFLFNFRKMFIDLNKREFVACSTKGWVGRSYQQKTIIEIDDIKELIFYYSYSDSRNKVIPDFHNFSTRVAAEDAYFAADFIHLNGKAEKVMVHHIRANDLLEMKRCIKMLNPDIAIKTDMSYIRK